MKTEDFERLKAICEKEGFTIESYSGGKTAIIGVKDEWEGVEFAKALGTGCIFKIVDIDADKITYHLRYNDRDGQLNSYKKEIFKPSTEQEYVEQLKKEAFEKFGEIKKGDRFDRSNLNTFTRIIEVASDAFGYDKCHDVLLIGGFIIYEKGKWATKLYEVKEVAQFTYDIRLSEGCNARIITPEGREIIVS